MRTNWFTYNFRDGNETVSLLDIERAIGSESSDFTDSASPKNPSPIWVMDFLLLGGDSNRQMQQSSGLLPSGGSTPDAP